jgi:hypothetical protein
VRREGVIVFDPAETLVASACAPAAHSISPPTPIGGPRRWRRSRGELAAIVKADVALPDGADPGYRTQSREVRQLGDIVAMLDLPAGQSLYALETAWMRRVVGPRRLAVATGARGRRAVARRQLHEHLLARDDGVGRVGGVGGAAELRVEASGRSDRAERRGGLRDPGAPGQALREEPDRLDTVRVVIWQFAARELAFGDWRLSGSGLGAVVYSRSVTKWGQTPRR